MRRTRSHTALLSKAATAKTAAGTTSPTTGPPAKKHKTKKAEDTATATAVTKAPPPERLQRLQRVINPLRKVTDSDTSLEFPAVSSAPRGHPKIYYGQNAPLPRWRTLLDDQDLGAHIERDLIRTHPGRTIIPGVAPNTHPKAHDNTLGLGDLKWSFDPGPASVWGNLTGQELYAYAHGLLMVALQCKHSRRQLGYAIRNEQYASLVANVEDPVPPPPRLDPSGAVAPLSSTLNRILASTKALKTKDQTFPDDDKHGRPELKYQPDQDVSDKEKDFPIASVMKKNMKGTLGPVDQQDPSLDPVAVLEVKATKKRLPTRTKATKKGSKKESKKTTKQAAVNDDKQQTHKGAGARDIGSEEKLHNRHGTPANQPVSPIILAPEEIYLMLDKISDINRARSQVEDMHRAKAQQDGQAQQTGSGKDADKYPFQPPDAGSTQTAESSTALNGEPVREIDKILFPPEKPDETTKYLQMCNEIVADPEARRKHYPDVEAFRRIRTWAGAVIPEKVETHVKANFVKVPTANRPFTNMKRPREEI
ncbi:uncharacterized protein N7473_007317 [Penicillium subrubescens]|uniref:uncharacterized protein n=1 Tax=Penicillium subrubescens TaxID=1316194 RepID=UPI00254567EE|nr:uncharacterized protein N7473_007317 [Penicillium subrubescens]KAJ5891089.1 hypothetical protein N7473_007317 [Penicillium subrubescens]